MKRIQKSMIAVLLVLATVMVSCGGKKTLEHATVIPQDASIIFAYNAKKICDKADLNSEKYSMFKDAIIQQMQKEINNPVASDMFKDLIQKQEFPGLNNTADVFFFMTAKGIVGFSGAVTDQAKAMEALKVICEKSKVKPVEEDGIFKISTSKAVCMLSDKVILVAGAANHALKAENGKLLNEEVLKMLAQTKENSVVSTKIFKEMMSQEADIMGYLNYEQLFNSDLPGFDQAKASVKMYSKMMKGYELADLNLVMSLNTEKGKAQIKSKLVANSEAAQKALAEQTTSLVGKINGKFNEFLPATTPMSMTVGIDGEKIFNYISALPQMQQMLQQVKGLDVKEMFSSMKGDMSLNVVTISTQPVFTVYSEMKNTEMLDQLVGLAKMSGMPLKEFGDKKYAMQAGMMPVYFGQEEGIFYITSDANVSADVQQKVEKSLATTEYGSRAEGKVFYWLLNLEEIAKNPMVGMVLGRQPGVLDFLKKFKAIEMEAEALTSTTTLTLTEEVNPLALIVDFAVKSQMK